MRESATYQAILEEGRAEGAVEEARKLLRMIGEGILGRPDSQAASAIGRIDNLGQLEALCERLRSATSWQHLLGLPASGRRGKRRRSSP